MLKQFWALIVVAVANLTASELSTSALLKIGIDEWLSTLKSLSTSGSLTHENFRFEFLLKKARTEAVEVPPIEGSKFLTTVSYNINIHKFKKKLERLNEAFYHRRFEIRLRILNGDEELWTAFVAMVHSIIAASKFQRTYSSDNHLRWVQLFEKSVVDLEEVIKILDSRYY